MNRPVALVCYICGRQFGTKSLAIHLKACEKKWENEENLKPPKLRRPCPQPPREFQKLLTKDKITKEDMNKFNAQSFDTFVEDALVQCQYCGRRFNPKSLIPHQKACKINPMVKKPYVSKGAVGKVSQSEQPIKPLTPSYNYKEPMGKSNQADVFSGDLEPCRRCGRKFLSDRVAKHERVCKADPVEIKKAPVVQKKVEQPTKLKPAFGKQKKAKWKVQHQELQNAMKAIRQLKSYQAKGGKLSDLPPPPASNYDHYIECRHCGRKYAPDVAERHIPKCANIINKPGGIKPSRIQEKYVSGMGSGMSKVTQNPIVQQSKISNNTPFKPNFSTSSSNSKANGSTKQASNGYGNYSNNEYMQQKGGNMGSKINNLQTKKYQMPSSSGNSNPFGNNMYQMGSNSKASKLNPSSEITSSNFKPNLKSNSKPTSNKYW